MAAPRDMAGALAELGVKVSREDQLEVYGWCPLHEKYAGKPDNKPSWSINKANGSHHCFSCGYGGMFLGLVMDMAFEDDAFAASRWIRKFGVNLVDTEELPDYLLREFSVEPEGMEMNESRLSAFYLPPEGPLEDRSVTLESCEFYEILWDVTEFGWVFPIRDYRGDLIGWQFKGHRSRTFLNYPEHMSKGDCVFGLDKVDEGEEVTIIESPLDCAYLRSAGVLNAVSSMGANVTDAQMRLILEKTDRVVLALDNDEAGKMATRVIARGEVKRGKVTRQGWMHRFASMRVFDYDMAGGGKDPGEIAYEDCVIGYGAAKTVIDLGLRPVDRTPFQEKAKRRAATR
jgi:hypothetical protein